MNADPDRAAEPVRTQGGDGSTHPVDASHAMGVQVGEGNTQFIYNYASKLTWTDGVAPPPLMSVSGVLQSPYRGLSAFEERDAALFFGRETAATQVLERMSRCLTTAGLLVVSGVSGAGKSSLLKAGVLPRVRGAGLGDAPGAAAWRCLVFTPTREPLEQLAVRVAPLAGTNAPAIRSSLDADPGSFALTVRQAALAQPGPAADPGDSPGRRLLLVIDQFEEVFTQCTDEQQRRAFITAITAAASGDGPDRVPAALVVLGIRADFEARCADYPQLTDAIQDRYLVTSMTERQLRMAIVEPALMAGSGIEDALVDVLLREVSTRRPASAAIAGPALVTGAGALPLLSHALDQAWRKRTGDILTLADYERTGGIEGAVAESAQRAYDQLTPAQQGEAQQVFIQLTATSIDGTDTSDRATRAELADSKSEAETRDVEAVLEAFAGERLLVLDAGTVEIGHEVLLTAWPLLRDTWLAETHSDRIVRTRLHNSAAEWIRGARDSSYLYTGSLLEAAAATANRIAASPARYPHLSQSERDFLRASERSHQRGTRRRQGTIAILAALVIGLTAVALIAVHNSRAANSARDVADSGRLIAESQALGDSNSRLAKLETAAAWRVNHSSEARYAMLAAARLPGNVILTSGTDPVDSVTYSPDGKTLAVGVGNGTVRLWDVATRRPAGMLRSGHGGALFAVKFSPDGKVLAIAGTYGQVQLWDVAKRQLAGSLTSSAPEVTNLAFSSDGKVLAVGRDNGTVQLWGTASRQQMGTLHVGNTFSTPKVAFSPDGETLATASTTNLATNVIRLWDVATRQPIGAPLPGVIQQAVSVAFSPDGKTLAAGNPNSSVQFWNLETHQQMGSPVFGNTGSVESVAFSPDGKILAASSYDGNVELRNVASRREIGISLTGNARPVVSVAFSPDGTTLAAGSWDGTVRLWDIAEATGDPAGSFAGTSTIDSVAFSPDGRTLATGSWDKTARLWDAATRRQIGPSLAAETNWVSAVAFSKNGKTLVTGSWDGTARLWNVTPRKQLGILKTGTTAIESVAFSPDRKIVATGGFTGIVRLWNVTTGKQVGTLNTKAGIIYSVAFSPDGKILATGDGDDTVELWNPAARKRIATLTPPDEAAVYSVAFSPDGRTLAAGYYDGTVRLWDLATRQLARSLTGDTATVSSVAFSPDGRTLATGSYDATARLWNLATDQQIGAPLNNGSNFAVDSVAFSPDGKTLASGSYAGGVQLWDVSYLMQPVPYLCTSAGTTLTRAEWAQAVPGLKYQNICP